MALITVNMGLVVTVGIVVAVKATVEEVKVSTDIAKELDRQVIRTNNLFFFKQTNAESTVICG
jgi:hypothetical protein